MKSPIMTDGKSDNKQKLDLGLLEEDDEFEEFPAESEYALALLLNINIRNTHKKKKENNYFLITSSQIGQARMRTTLI